jgi:hypothetical protein
MNGLKGIIKGISTKTRIDAETGGIEHLTSIKLLISDLDKETLDALALAEASLRLVSVELTPDSKPLSRIIEPARRSI